MKIEFADRVMEMWLEMNQQIGQMNGNMTRFMLPWIW